MKHIEAYIKLLFLCVVNSLTFMSKTTQKMSTIKKDVSQKCMKQFAFTAEEFIGSDTIHTLFFVR